MLLFQHFKLSLFLIIVILLLAQLSQCAAPTFGLTIAPFDNLVLGFNQKVVLLLPDFVLLGGIVVDDLRLLHLPLSFDESGLVVELIGQSTRTPHDVDLVAECM